MILPFMIVTATSAATDSDEWICPVELA